MAIHIGEYVRDRADILAWLRHHRSDGLTNIGGIDATYRERLLVTLAPNAAFITRTGVHRRPAQRVGEKNAAVLDYVLMPSTSLSFKGRCSGFLSARVHLKKSNALTLLTS
jgi:hypothetical protein